MHPEYFHSDNLFLKYKNIARHYVRLNAKILHDVVYAILSIHLRIEDDVSDDTPCIEKMVWLRLY